MKHICNLKQIAWLFITLPFFLVSCEDKMSEYYKEPEWLKGSIFEVLQDKGDYTIFLKAIEKSGFKPIVNGKSILTVMAPDDDAFTNYLEETYGTGKTIDDLSLPDLKKLVGYHILYYALDRKKLINFRPEEGDAATEDELNVNAGLYYKFRTKSQDSITTELDTAGDYVSVYHLERFLPVFSYRMFNTKQIDAAYNYEYFYPDTEWSDEEGFNVSNAKVDTYSVLSDNGYIYLIDKVLKPLETIYGELSSNSDYSDFLTLYDKYDYYQIDDNLTLEYGNGVDLYQHYHTTPLPNIACEWPVTNYQDVLSLSYTSYSLFAPNNTALRGFFDDYWKIGGYDSLYEVSLSSIQYLLYNCIYASSLVFPEEITNGNIVNSYGTTIKFDVDEVPQENRIMCLNGTLYGCDELTPPAMFGSVTGPAFQYKKFSYFLKMLTNSDLIMTLCSDNTKYIMLYPSDDVMTSDGVTMVNDLLYRGDTKITSSYQQNYSYAHVINLDAITGGYSELPSSSDVGNHVFRTLLPASPLYWYMHNGKITNSFKLDELLYDPTLTEEDVFCDLSELSFRGDGWSNGKCYEYSNTNKSYLFEGTLDNAAFPKFVPMMIANRTDETTLFYGFVQVLKLAGMLDISSESITEMIENCLIFVPTTTALKEGILRGALPGISTTNSSVNDADFFTNCTVTDLDALAYYLLQYFIPISTATISNYPYVGWEETTPNGLPTMQSFEETGSDGKVATYYTNIYIVDDGSKLSIYSINPGGITSSTVNVNGSFYYFPFVFNDGCIHFLDNVL
jgi:uncharacterized surface protein with fasciclin (FAS1) repeats